MKRGDYLLTDTGLALQVVGIENAKYVLWLDGRYVGGAQDDHRDGEYENFPGPFGKDGRELRPHHWATIDCAYVDGLVRQGVWERGIKMMGGNIVTETQYAEGTAWRSGHEA